MVRIGSTFSDVLEIDTGSPQGAILSPTMFIILVADMEEWTQAKVHSYADDTTATSVDIDIQG